MGQPTFSCSGPTRRPSCTSSTYMQGGLGPALVCSLVGGSVSDSPKDLGQLILMVFLQSFYPFRGCSPFLYLFKGDPNLHQMFSVALCICLSQLLGEASKRTTMLASFLQAQQSMINSVKDWCLPMLTVPSLSVLPSVPGSCISYREDEF